MNVHKSVTSIHVYSNKTRHNAMCLTPRETYVFFAKHSTLQLTDCPLDVATHVTSWHVCLPTVIRGHSKCMVCE